MFRALNAWLSGESVQDHIRKARMYSRYALACAARSTSPFDSWAAAARLHRTRRDAFMWSAREIVGRPKRFSSVATR